MPQTTCPVCNGRGMMPPGFYDPSSTAPERCRTCGGTTVVESAMSAPDGGSSDPLDLTGD